MATVTAVPISRTKSRKLKENQAIESAALLGFLFSLTCSASVKIPMTFAFNASPIRTGFSFGCSSIVRLLLKQNFVSIVKSQQAQDVLSPTQSNLALPVVD